MPSQFAHIISTHADGVQSGSLFRYLIDVLVEVVGVGRLIRLLI